VIVVDYQWRAAKGLPFSTCSLTYHTTSENSNGTKLNGLL
jgi:hypothetical protein